MTSSAFISTVPQACMQRSIQRISAALATMMPYSSSDSSWDCSARCAEATIEDRNGRELLASTILSS